MAKQLIVFLENRPGTLQQVTGALSRANVNILSLNLADTDTFGVLRLIVDEPDLGLRTLTDAGITARTTDVFVVRLRPEPGSLHEMLECLPSGCDLRYIYPYATMGVDAGMVFKVTNPDAAREVLENAGTQLI